MKEFLEYQNKINDKQYVINMLRWDLKISSPENSKDDLINLIGKLEEELFELLTSNKYGKVLKNCIESEEFQSLSIKEQRFIQKLLRGYENNKKIPLEFYLEHKKLCDKSTMVWTKAKANDDYEMFKPYLKKIIESTKKYYTYMKPEMKVYNAMLDEFEEGLTIDIVDKLFNEIKKELLPIIKNLKPKKTIKIKQNYTKEELIDCAYFILDYMGLDTNDLYLGIFPHGFMTKIGVNDIRIAFNAVDNPIDFLTTIIHEGGHALFEQNVDEKLSKLDNNCIENLNALHECQSRFYENILGRNINFWKPIYNEIKKRLKINLSLKEFAEELNIAKPSLIRIDADELTYCLHIIIRYEIEKEIFENDIDLDTLPELWNEKTEEYLGLQVKSAKEGILQDIHWSGGEFGYFPSYLIGTIYGGMFKETIEEKLGSIDELLKDGRLQEITDFLIKNIYKNGSAFTSNEIIQKVCKKQLSTKPIIKYFKNKYDSKNN